RTLVFHELLKVWKSREYGNSVYMFKLTTPSSDVLADNLYFCSYLTENATSLVTYLETFSSPTRGAIIIKPLDFDQGAIG
ncbi:TPA: hypothetical protein ACN30T_004829, partial [Vibrio parahaemolyticus]